MNSNTAKITADGQITQARLGNFLYLYVREATASFEISFNGNDWRTASLNDGFGPLAERPSRVYFRAKNGVASEVTVDYDQTPIAAQSTQQKIAKTFAYGSRKVGVTTVKANAVAIPNGYLGKRRKSILFTVDFGGAGANQFMTILDADGNYFAVIVTGQLLPPIETDGEFSAFASTGGMDLYCGEIYYNENI